MLFRSPNSATNHSVTVTLKPSEKVTVTNNGDYTVDEDGNIYNIDGVMIPGLKADENGDVWDTNGNYVTNINPFTYEFLSNGEFTFEFVDAAGNKGTATAKVDWIDTKAPKATIEYDITSLTNKNVTASISFDEENVTVTNNNKKTNYVFTKNGEFTFEFRDAAGNTGSITAKVDWIDKVAPTAELKYEKQKDKVIVSVINPSKEITFKEGNGIYEYTKNGNYEIIFYDSLGNVGKLIATIDSFKDENNDDENKPENPDKPSKPDDGKPDNPNNPDDSTLENPEKPNNDNNNNDDNIFENNVPSIRPNVPNKPNNGINTGNGNSNNSNINNDVNNSIDNDINNSELNESDVVENSENNIIKDPNDKNSDNQSNVNVTNELNTIENYQHVLLSGIVISILMLLIVIGYKN